MHESGMAPLVIAEEYRMKKQENLYVLTFFPGRLTWDAYEYLPQGTMYTLP